MAKLDPRLHPYRRDLAAVQLRDRVSAERYVSGNQRSVTAGIAPLRRAPSPTAPLDTELLFGETVQVYEDKEGWSWLQAAADGYVGFVPSDALGEVPPTATHTLTSLRSYVFPEPDLKQPPQDMLSMNASLTVQDEENGYSQLAGGGWVYTRHLAPTGTFERDFVAVAERFLGTPYLWGGRSSIGLDCSALIQISLARCGQAVPRDTDMQEYAIGLPVPYDGNDTVLKRGDLVYWPGHAGIWIDEDRFIHANATDMMVSVAPLRDVAPAIEASTGDRIRSIRRPGSTGA